MELRSRLVSCEYSRSSDPKRLREPIRSSRRGLIRVGKELFDFRANAFQMFGTSVMQGAGYLLFQNRHADHEKLVEIREQDGEELDAFEQRVVGVLRLFEHAALEGQQAQLAVDVQVEVVGGKRKLDQPRDGVQEKWSSPQS